jgi:Fe-S cluster assembly protein SufD
MNATFSPARSQEASAMDRYSQAFTKFEQTRGVAQPPWLFPLRKAGLARFGELGFPTPKHEDWRFTNLAALAKLPFNPILTAPAEPPRSVLEQFPFSQLPGARLVFLDGHFSPALSTLPTQPDGVRVSSLSAALTEAPAWLEKQLGRTLRAEDNAFAALNNAFFLDGGVIHVPAGKTVPEPVQLLFISTSQEPGAVVHPRNLVVVEREARLTLLESYVSLATGATFTNAATEFALGDHAVVEHCKFQDESTEAYHLASLHSHLGRAVTFSSHSIVTGARLSRNHIRTTLDGEGIECVLNGVYLTDREQLADHYMLVDHAKPHCASHEYFNGILAGKSKGVFHGRILVRPGAQKTDAKQTNKNLLLSDDASADAKPQLEIYADDVKCTHGATIGQLNDESIYYMRTRGIDLETARRMLIHAFAGEIIDRVKYEPLREELDRLLWDRLEQIAEPALSR